MLEPRFKGLSSTPATSKCARRGPLLAFERTRVCPGLFTCVRLCLWLCNFGSCFDQAGYIYDFRAKPSHSRLDRSNATDGGRRQGALLAPHHFLSIEFRFGITLVVVQ